MHPSPLAATPAAEVPSLPTTQSVAFGQLPATLAPDRSLFTYYALTSLLAGPAFIVPMIVLYFRYHTLRYVVEDEGITMRWGILFRREISLTYARIQDIHLTSNFVERWLGLAKVQVQTASGSSNAEMTIEGLPQFEAIRDFLYSKMRGARDRAATTGHTAHGELAAGPLPEVAEALREVAAEVRALRRALPAPGGAEDGHV